MQVERRPERGRGLLARGLLARGLRGGGRAEHRESLQSVRAAAHRLGDQVVGRRLQRGGIGRREAVQAGRRERQHLDVHADPVHRREPVGVEVPKTTVELAFLSRAFGRVLPLRVERAPGVERGVGCQVFFEGDDVHPRGLVTVLGTTMD